MSTLRYRFVQEGPEIPQCPGVYGDPLPKRKSTRDRRHHYTTHPIYSGTILVGEQFCSWLKPPLRITTPTLTLYWVLLEVKS